MISVTIRGYIDPHVSPRKLKDGTEFTTLLCDAKTAAALQAAGLVEYSEATLIKDVPAKYKSKEGNLFHVFASHENKEKKQAVDVDVVVSELPIKEVIK